MRLLVESAMAQCETPVHMAYVGDGEHLLRYLRHEGEYADRKRNPAPRAILLDLNMPNLSGIEALAEIKADPALRRTPIVALTVQDAKAEIDRAYALGVNAFITKPISYDQLCRTLNAFAHFWFGVVQLPDRR